MNTKPLVTLSFPEKTIHLLGTAHVSQQSVLEVEQCVEEFKPDVLCIELCEQRHQALKQPNQWAKLDILSVIKEKKTGLLLAQIILSSFQRKMGERMKTLPGAEMIAALNLAEEKNISFELIDRNIRVTFLRAWRLLGFFERIKFFFGLLSTLFFTPKISTEEIEELKIGSNLSAAMEAFSRQFPSLRKVLIQERDQYMAQKIQQLSGKNLLVVLGAGHLEGVAKTLKDTSPAPKSLQELNHIPSAGLFYRFFPWLLVSGILLLFVYGFWTNTAEASWQMIENWFWANSVLAAAGALLAWSHPVSILVAFFSAPFTSLNPMIAAGWVTGLCEAWLRKPKVEDFSHLNQDILSFKGLFRNSITHLLLVVAFTNLGSTLGTTLGVVWISNLFT